MTASDGPMDYRRDIDGLRAIAVMGVIFHHAGVALISGGYAGVDIFFVISGFLIGGIVAKERAEGRFSYRAFYARRARRILPALIFVILCTLPFAWTMMMPEQLRYFGGGAASTLIFLSNVWFFYRIDYFNPRAIEDPLIHTWSLGVEEQFYIALPILLLLLWRLGRRTVIVGLSILAALSFGWAAATSADRSMEAFYLIHTRAWELLAGVLAALLQTSIAGLNGKVKSGAAGIGLLMVLLGLFATPRDVAWPGTWTVIPVMGTVLIVVFGTVPSLARSLLSVRPLVGIGLISYSAYLWHQPILGFLAVADMKPATTPAIAGVVTLTLLLAALSWRFVEEPFRRGRLPRRLGRGLLWGGGLLIAAVAIGGHVTKGYPSRIPQDVRAVLAYSDLRPSTYLKCISNRQVDEAIAPQDACVHGADVVASIAIWGDSHAAQLAQPLGQALRESGLSVRELSGSSCIPIPGVVTEGQQRTSLCVNRNETVLNYLLNSPEIRVVVIHAYWNSYIQHRDYDNGLGDLYRDALYSRAAASRNPIDDAERQQVIGAQLNRTVAALAQSGKRVILLYPFPDAGFNVPDRMARNLWRGGQIVQSVAIPREVFHSYSAPSIALLNDAAKIEGATGLDLSGMFCGVKTGCVVVEDGVPLFFDGNHLSLAGSAKVVPELSKAVLQALVMPR